MAVWQRQDIKRCGENWGNSRLEAGNPRKRLTYGGEGGIRTHGGFAPTPDFESGTFDHSATSPVRATGGSIAGRAALRHTLVKPDILAETVIHLIDT